jgi:cardiolipin synthase
MADRIQPQGADPFAIDVAGNRLTLLTDGPARLEALLALIASAERSLRILYYIFKDDESGSKVRDAILAACARGVKVTILIDGFGSQDVPDSFFQPLVDSKCRFCRFQPRWGRRFLLRNHQKLALADEGRLLGGGFNISDEYFGTIEEGAWRDIGLKVEGPAVACLADYYDDLFNWARARDGQFRKLRRMLEKHSQKEGALRWLFGGPTRRLSPWARTIKSDMMGARRLDLVAAYFAPNRAMLRRIAAIAKRDGARLVTAAKSDNGATVGAARYTYGRLLRNRTEIFEYQPTKMHTKLIVVEDVVHIGSANFDMRSLYLNLEVMLRIEDAGLAAMMRRFVDGEAAASEAITLEAHRERRTWLNRLVWGLCYFVVATTDYNVTRRLNFGVKGR